MEYICMSLTPSLASRSFGRGDAFIEVIFDGRNRLLVRFGKATNFGDYFGMRRRDVPFFRWIVVKVVQLRRNVGDRRFAAVFRLSDEMRFEGTMPQRIEL